MQNFATCTILGCEMVVFGALYTIFSFMKYIYIYIMFLFLFLFLLLKKNSHSCEFSQLAAPSFCFAHNFFIQTLF